MKLRRLPALDDPRLWLLAVALALAAVAWTGPGVAVSTMRTDVLAVVDLTGSMNVRDYSLDGKPASRLDFAKVAIQRLLARLPCGSRMGVAVFSERRAFLLFEPVEVCANYAPVMGTLSALDWRMAWEGDSRIAAGLYSALDTARELKSNLVFLTDGQEAPPLPASGRPPFEGKVGEVGGLIVGVGGYQPVPIPKFGEDGYEVGVFGPDEVDQQNRAGLPPADAAGRDGWNPRNAPFGGKAAAGDEHLSSVRETYLRELGSDTGLGYLHLERADDLGAAFLRHAHLREESARMDLALPLAAGAWLLLAAVYLWRPGVPSRPRGERRFPWLAHKKRRI